MDEKCLFKRCYNGGTCVRVDNDEYCNCENNFSGEYCEQLEDYCLNNFCENNSTCVETETDYQCLCHGGYIGKRCHYLPCDYTPCSENSICYNINHEENTTKKSYT